MEKSKLTCEMIWKIQKKIVKWFGKYGRKISWIVKWFGWYGRNVSWLVKRFGKYRRKESWIVKIWKISVLVINTPNEFPFSSSLPLFLPLLTSFSSSFPPSSSFSLYSCIYIVFQNWEESSWNSFFARDYASRDLTLRLFSRNTTVRARTW